MADKNENTETQQGQPQAFAPFPAAGGATDPPSWAVPPAAKPKRRRRGRSLLLALVLVVVAATATAFVTAAVVDDPADVQNNAADQEEPSPDQQAPPPAEQVNNNAPQNVPAGTGDLGKGSVFVQSNDLTANEVVAFARKGDGTLREVGRYPTGGAGSGSFEDAAQGLVLGTAEGEASPIQNVDQAEMLFALNAGSSTISVFRVNPDGLELVSQVPSGGKRPVSVTVNNGLLYVLNSGETDRRLVLGPEDNLLENCSHGDLPSVTGFRITGAGSLTPIENSTRQLSGRGMSGCSQISFTPDGKTLVATERIASMAGQDQARKGVITTFDVRYDGALGTKRLIDPSGVGPFGFNFLKDGTLIVSEQNGALANPGGGGAASYKVNSDKSLRPINGTVDNGQTDTCWITVTDDQKLAFAANAFTGGSISSYQVRDDGGLELLHPVASAPDGEDAKNDKVQDGLTDMALSRDTKFLYQLNSLDGSLWVFKVNSNGLLSHVQTHKVFDLEPFGQGGEAAPFGISAW